MGWCTAAWSCRGSPCATRPTAASPARAAPRCAVRSPSAEPSASPRSPPRAERATRPSSRLPSKESMTVMSASIRVAIVSLGVACLACPQPSRPSARQATAGIDSLNAALIRAYRSHDPLAYAALYTDTAVVEWPAVNTVRVPADLAAMARSNWASLNDMDLRLTVSARRVAPDHATEFGAFEQSWRDSSGLRRREVGRYVAFLLRQAGGSWRVDRFVGSEDWSRARG